MTPSDRALNVMFDQNFLAVSRQIPQRVQPLTDADFAELKQRFPQYVTDDDRALDFATLLRKVEDGSVDDR